MDQDRAWQVAGKFVDKNGIANPNMLKPGEDLGVEVMKRAMEEMDRRRAKQVAYNREHNIKPATIRKKQMDCAARHE